jgi:molecular chaperone DnaJ
MARRKRDYYAVLGVDRAADDAEIKRAYRELARKYHPDLNPGGAETFKQINEAYAVLSDPRERSRYDRWGHEGEGGSVGGGFASVVDAAQEVISDVLRRTRKTKQRGRDLRYTLEVSFEEAAFGCTRTIQVPLDPSGDPATRPATREFSVVVPPGTRDGAVKMMKGEGEPGKSGGPPGDLHVMVRVKEHATFKRDGHDIQSELHLTFAQAALGAVLEVPTIDGPVKLRIPEGTQSGRTLRIRGRGVPRGAGKNAGRGDHLVRIAVVTPTNLSSRQRELLEELGRTLGELERSGGGGEKKGGLLERVRSLLDG